jgi:hypothetical protein
MVSTKFAALVALAAVGFSSGAEAARPPITRTHSNLTSPTILPRDVLENLLEIGVTRKSDPADCHVCSRPSPGTTASVSQPADHPAR